MSFFKRHHYFVLTLTLLKGHSQIIPGARTASKNHYLNHIIFHTVIKLFGSENKLKWKNRCHDLIEKLCFIFSLRHYRMIVYNYLAYHFFKENCTYKSSNHMAVAQERALHMVFKGAFTNRSRGPYGK